MTLVEAAHLCVIILVSCESSCSIIIYNYIFVYDVCVFLCLCVCLDRRSHEAYSSSFVCQSFRLFSFAVHAER